MTMKTFAQSATLVAVSVILWPLSVAALEPLAVYEDWSAGFIRSDRWLGSENTGGQEVRREVTSFQAGPIEISRALKLRYRVQGSTVSNTGSITLRLRLEPANPSAINQIEAGFTVTNLAVTSCAANNSALGEGATAGVPAVLFLSRFNDGSGGAGNRTGDHTAFVEAFRSGSSTDPAGVLRVAGGINRCSNANCNPNQNVSFTVLASTVTVGQPFTLRLIWDQPNHQFLFGANNDPATALPYSASDAAPSIVPAAAVEVIHKVANCTAGAITGDLTTNVGTVRTNSSAVIP